MTEYIHCTICKRMEWEVSEEDPDTTLSEAFGHVNLAHTGADLARAVTKGRATAWPDEVRTRERIARQSINYRKMGRGG